MCHNLQVEGVVDEAEEWAFEVDVFGDEKRDQADHGGTAVPALVLGVEGAAFAAVGGFSVEHGDESGADDDRRHEQEPDEAAALRDLLPHALAGDNLGDECPRDAQHGEPAVDCLGSWPVELHQALGVRVAGLRATFVLWTEEFLHW